MAVKKLGLGTGPAKAMVTRVIGIGTGLSGQVIVTVQAIVVTDSPISVYETTVPVGWDPTGAVATLATAVHDAVVAWAAGLGITIGAGRMLLPLFTKM